LFQTFFKHPKIARFKARNMVTLPIGDNYRHENLSHINSDRRRFVLREPLLRACDKRDEDIS
jgi:hypothetical protein